MLIFLLALCKKFLPYLIILGLIAGALAGVAGFGYSKGKATVQKRWDADKAALAQAVQDDLREQETARRKAQVNIQGAVARDQQEKLRIANNLRATQSDLDRLRADIQIRSGQAAASGCSSERDRANTADQLLGICAERYSNVAGEADRWASEARTRGEVIQSLIKN